MMKNLLFGLTTLLTFSLSAQEILLEEQFNDGTLGVFQAYSVIGDGQEWMWDDFQDDQFAEMNGFDGGVQDNEDWLISPALDMDQYDDEVLTFETASNFTGPDLELLVSTDYDGSSDPNTATWTDLSDEATLSSGDYEVTPSGDIDLSGFSGTGYIAFKYVSTSVLQGKLWQVDSIIVKANVLSSVREQLSDQEIISTPVVLDNTLQFNLLQEGKEVSFRLCSIEGRTYNQFRAAFGESTVRTSVAHLPKGMYVLIASRDGYLKGYKFVVQ
jgi:hypothetical protein